MVIKLKPMTKKAEINYIACLLGGAIGDALGAPIEFLKLDEIRSKFGENGVTDYIEFENNMGEFTDDTQLTLFTAEALLRAKQRAISKGIGGALPKMAHYSYLRWLHTQNIGINATNIQLSANILTSGWLVKQKELHKKRYPGNTCIEALSSGIEGTIENPINSSKGCGTIMRMAPVGLLFFGENERAFKEACEIAAITHGHPTGYLSAGVFASIIADLAVDIDLEIAVQNAVKILKQQKNNQETLTAIEKALCYFKNYQSNLHKIKAETIEEIGKGWIAEESLSIALFCSLIYKNDFKKGVLLSVNHGGDSDSTGSITGNMLGLINGVQKIPKKWINNLKYHNIVEEVAKDLYIQIKGDSLNEDDDWWDKYPGY